MHFYVSDKRQGYRVACMLVVFVGNNVAAICPSGFYPAHIVISIGIAFAVYFTPIADCIIGSFRVDAVEKLTVRIAGFYCVLF